MTAPNRCAYALMVACSVPPAFGQEQFSLSEVCQSKFGEGWDGRIERATGGPICAQVQGFSIVYQRLSDEELCEAGTPQVRDDGANYVCDSEAAPRADDAPVADVLKPLPPSPSGTKQPLPIAPEKSAAQAFEPQTAQPLRPLPRNDKEEVAPTPGDRTAEQTDDLPQIETDAILNPLSSDPAGNNLEIALSPLEPAGSEHDDAAMNAAVGGNWRGKLAEGIMPSPTLTFTRGESGIIYTLQTTYESCAREELLDGASPTMIAAPTLRPDFAAIDERDAQIAEMIATVARQQNADQETVWSALWAADAIPRAFEERSYIDALCRAKDGSAILTGPNAEALSDYHLEIAEDWAPTQLSFEATVSQIEMVITLCADIAAWQARNKAWVTGCAPLDGALQDEVLAMTPAAPPGHAAMLADTWITSLIPVDGIEMLIDDGAGPDMPF